MIGLLLLKWWIARLRSDAEHGFRQWARDPEWPLLVVAVVFFSSFLVHWLGYRMAVHRVGWPLPFFAETQWEGRTGWRKPLVFGISNAMVFVSLWHALRSQLLFPRRAIAHLAAWSTAVEVGIITLQAWRDVPSHFNTSTPLDTCLYAIKLTGVLFLSLACVAVTIGIFVCPCRINGAKMIALRHGLVLLCLSIAVGVAQVVYGHSAREYREDESDMCLWATAGSSGSPCYEIHGQAIIKLAHFLPLHATEVLLLLAWAVERLNGRQDHKLIKLAAAGCWCISILGLLLTWQGINIKTPTTVVGISVVLSLLPVPLSFIWVFVSPLTELTAKRAGKQQINTEPVVVNKIVGG